MVGMVWRSHGGDRPYRKHPFVSKAGRRADCSLPYAWADRDVCGDRQLWVVRDICHSARDGKNHRPLPGHWRTAPVHEWETRSEQWNGRIRPILVPGRHLVRVHLCHTAGNERKACHRLLFFHPVCIHLVSDVDHYLGHTGAADSFGTTEHSSCQQVKRAMVVMDRRSYRRILRCKLCSSHADDGCGPGHSRQHTWNDSLWSHCGWPRHVWQKCPKNTPDPVSRSGASAVRRRSHQSHLSRVEMKNGQTYKTYLSICDSTTLKQKRYDPPTQIDE